MQPIDDIFRSRHIDAYGVCSFSAVSGRLLSAFSAVRLPEQAQSIIAVLFPYQYPDNTRPHNLARYACVPDYHTRAGAVLADASAALSARFPGYVFTPFIDNSPIPEVIAAAAAGLGVIGGNGLLLSPVYGSFTVIGTIVTDLTLPVTGDGTVNRCKRCGLCATACPVHCIGNPDKPKRCLSAVSQRKGTLTPEETALLRANKLVWGCDRCQDVCPYNTEAVIRPHPCFDGYEPWLDQAGLDDLREKAYAWRGRAVLERNLELINNY